MALDLTPADIATNFRWALLCNWENVGSGTHAVTATGDAITDASRTLALTGDGLTPPDSSFGIWEGATNLENSAGADVSFEVGTTGYTAGGTNTIAISLTHAKFGLRSCLSTYGNNAVLQSIALTLTAAAHSVSRWLYIPAAYDGTQVSVKAVNFAGASGTLSVNADMSLRDQWQRVSLTFTPAGGDLTGTIEIQTTGTPSAGKLLYIDGCQTEAKAYPSPFTITARTAARVQINIVGLGCSATTGAIGAAVRMGLASTAPASGKAVVWQWKDSGTLYLEVRYNFVTDTWEFERRNGSGTATASAAGAFSAGSIVQIAAFWSASRLDLYIGGVAGTPATGTQFVPALAAVLLDIGSDAGASQLDGDVKWIAMGNAAGSATDALRLSALGVVDPFPAALPPAIGGLWVWPADTTEYYQAFEDLSFYTTAGGTKRGREMQQIARRGMAGQGAFQLYSQDGRFSPLNATSPYAGLMLPNRRVRLLYRVGSTVYPAWAGLLDDLNPTANPYDVTTAALSAMGAMASLQEGTIYPPGSPGADTGTLAGVVLDASDFAGYGYVADVGQTITGRWYEWGANQLDALRRLEDTEFGAVFEDGQGRIIFANRLRRQIATSVLTISDNGDTANLPPGAVALAPLRQAIANQVVIQVPTYAVAPAPAVLWTYPTLPISLGPGQSLSMVAVYPGPDSASGGVAVDVWTTPVVGTDVIASGVDPSYIQIATLFSSTSIIPFKTSNSMRIGIRNTHTINTATLTTIQARGTAITSLAPAIVTADAGSSANAYGARKYAFPPVWLGDINTAADFGEAILLTYKDPQAIATVTFPATACLGFLLQALTREVGDRVTLLLSGTLIAGGTNLNFTADFFIESINLAWTGNGMDLICQWELSPAGVLTYFRFDISLFDGPDVFAF